MFPAGATTCEAEQKLTPVETNAVDPGTLTCGVRMRESSGQRGG